MELDGLGGLGGRNTSNQKAAQDKEEDNDWELANFGVGSKSASRTGGVA